MKAIKIAVGSDIYPTHADVRLFEDGNVITLLGDLLPEWQGADFSFVNVESPLTAAARPITKTGPHLKASPKTIRFYKALAVTAAGLANNHLRDFGADGVMDTLKLFADAGLATVGGGATLEEARQPLVHQFRNGKKLGIMAMAEREFGIAGDNLPGANPIDFVNYTILAELKKQAHKVIVILHGGTENYPYPRPGLVDLCHFLADQGADAVVVQHTHCVGCCEHYHGIPILYGQGNFIFRHPDPRIPMPAPWREGLHLNLIWDLEGDTLSMEFIPFEQNQDAPGIRRLDGERLKMFWAAFEARSTLLKNRARLAEAWSDFCERQKTGAILNVLGIAGFPGKICRRLPTVACWLKWGSPPLTRNMITCESHRELVTAILEKEYRTHETRHSSSSGLV